MDDVSCRREDRSVIGWAEAAPDMIRMQMCENDNTDVLRRNSQNL